MTASHVHDLIVSQRVQNAIVAGATRRVSEILLAERRAERKERAQEREAKAREREARAEQKYEARLARLEKDTSVLARAVLACGQQLAAAHIPSRTWRVWHIALEVLTGGVLVGIMWSLWKDGSRASRLAR
jgi:hypothetical protein